MLSVYSCNLCPRECGVDRMSEKGFCGRGAAAEIARAALHFWEEPCISGKRGSGTVFFCGCTLRCCYCQNYSISRGNTGKTVSAERLARIFIELQQKGAHNINLVTATQFLTEVKRALDIAKPELNIPVVWNTGGYEKTEVIDALLGYVDIYLPDLKYFSGVLSAKYSGAKDYFEKASEAVKSMVAQTGSPEFDDEGVMQKGTVIRHMLLPGSRDDSMNILGWMSDFLPKDGFMLSLLSQYTPSFKADEFPELDRKITTYEYELVVREAERQGLKGYMQRRDSACKMYVPDFNLEGV